MHRLMKETVKNALTWFKTTLKERLGDSGQYSHTKQLTA